MCEISYVLAGHATSYKAPPLPSAKMPLNSHKKSD